ncbi:Na+/H+ antiporter NhaC [Clostridium algidicarnis]|uniref:Transporter (NhaC family) n=2 Tax=Clostridium algidicarnis TaxID=37659 RepID=A0A2S6G0D2_9CLOT|nr:Na+/H+ antiporter NhaC [Clostridium algidicarnis]MBB6630768.1 Na+/H+ antiporter NhaC [Clostridium algidicarnis]MBB6696528.1 Na+/H+ antiporter NhaC [Clostridium algidicarnis]MBU3202843.1 Na+/H+ antiporter NhaC [Clostridium algidicarnis]MBU3205855.1 Na+/H+ antiporter NhaC [Clostridium algidicarnis]MBU3210997.1 Na+/H+ antiporter NhaC [Clostridium algidicarnis]
MNKEKRKPSFFLAVLPIITMILFLGIGYGVMGLAAEVLMLCSAAVAGIIAIYLGYTWDDIMNSIVQKLSKTMPAIFILIIVGFLIGSWMIGGTIPMMVYYGLKIINPKYIVITSFLVTAVVSVCTGTSWGSAGTIGVALMGVASGMGAPLPIVAGAIVSGAYFGDKMSPLSDTTNLAPIAAGSKLYDHIQHMFYTTLPGFVICCIVYTFVGFNMVSGASNSGSSIVSEILGSLNMIFSLNIFTVIPVLMVLYGSIRKKPTIPVMLLSSTIAFVNAIAFQGFTIKQCFDAAIGGFKLEMISPAIVDYTTLIPDITRLLQRGGMMSMLGTVLIAFCAYGFAGTLAVTGSLDIVLEKLMKSVKSTGQLIVTTIISCITCVFVTSNGQLSILIPGEMFSKTYIKRGLAPKNLSRTLEDSATVVEPIVPWTAAGVYMATTLGVPTLSYLPWAIICYTGVIFAIIWGYTGFGIAKINEGDEYYEEYVRLNNESEV